MPGSIVHLGDSHDEASAWLARALLDAHNIPSEVVHVLSTGLTGRWHLAVRAEHAAAAAALLNAPNGGAAA